MIELGVSLPTVGPFATREHVLALARHAEDLGFDAVWVTDHVVLPFERRSPYPYPESRVPEAIYSAGVAWLDPIATLGVVAGATERVRLATSVIVLPYRNPLVLANETATLDHLSGGRLVLGVGAGWIAEEFRALGVSITERGARTDESIRVLRHLWSAERADFEGRFWSFSDVAIASRPAQRPGPPILVGGNGDAALRRAGRLGDGWHGLDVALDDVAAKVAAMRAHAEAAGRDPRALVPTVRRGIAPDFEVTSLAPERRTIGPTPEAAAREIDAYASAGVGHLCLDFLFLPDEAARVMEWVAKEVRPLLAGEA